MRVRFNNIENQIYPVLDEHVAGLDTVQACQDQIKELVTCGQQGYKSVVDFRAQCERHRNEISQLERDLHETKSQMLLMKLNFIAMSTSSQFSGSWMTAAHNALAHADMLLSGHSQGGPYFLFEEGQDADGFTYEFSFGDQVQLKDDDEVLTLVGTIVAEAPYHVSIVFDDMMPQHYRKTQITNAFQNV